MKDEYPEIYYDDWEPDRKMRVHHSFKEIPEEVKEFLKISETLVDKKGNKLKFIYADIFKGPPLCSHITYSNCVWVKLNKGCWYCTGNNNMIEEINKAKKFDSFEDYINSLVNEIPQAITGDLVEPVTREELDKLDLPESLSKHLFKSKDNKYFQKCIYCNKIKPYSRKYFYAINNKASKKYPLLRLYCKECKYTKERKQELLLEQNLMKSFINGNFITRKSPIFILTKLTSKGEYIYLGCFSGVRAAYEAREDYVKKSIYKHWRNNEDVLKKKFPILVVLPSNKSDKQYILGHK